MTLPTFVVIGAMKSGTTSLAHLLNQHPDVGVAPAKEVRFFSHDENWARGLAWYEDQFDDCSGAAIGDVSPAYSFHPVFPEAASRMASVLPNLALVYLVRDPIERIRSQYVHDTRAGRVIDIGIDDAVREYDRYLACSRYTTQLARYLEHYSADQILVVTSEALRDDPGAVLRDVHRHIGVNPEILPANPHERRNEASSTTRRTRPGLRRIRRHPVVRQVVRAIPAGVRDRFARVTSDPHTAAEDAMSPETRRWLAEELRAEVDGLRRFLPADFDGWGIDDD